MKNNLFSQKIEYLYNNLKIGEEAFVKLFWNGINPSFNTRKKTVIGKWYEQDIKLPKAFYFDNYPISKLNKNGKAFFTKQAFLDEPFEIFKKRVDTYISYTTRPKNFFEYKYIYYYDIHLKVVTFITIYTIEEISNNHYKIRIIPSKLYQDKDIDPYYGELHIINDYYHIYVKNSFEILTFYFMLNRGLKNNSTIYGLNLGLSYDKGLPISGKNLLSKKLLSEEEEKLFYLNASESDTLISDEPTQDIYSSTKENYLKKIYSKITNLTHFTKEAQKILKSIEQDIYLEFFHNRLNSLNEIIKKVYKNKTFYIFKRKNILKVFLKKLPTIPKSSCIIVYPLFAKDAPIFNQEAQQIINLLIETAQKGIKIEMIIISKFNEEIFQSTLDIMDKLIANNINIQIAPKEHISQTINNFDFIYSKSHKIGIYRNIKDKDYYFNITKDTDIINNLSYIYNKIKQYSYTIDNYLIQKNLQINQKLNYLVGRWYAYIYGTMKIDNRPKIWEIICYLDTNKQIEAFSKDKKLSYKGYINTNEAKKSYIVLTSSHSNNQSFITFNNKDIYKKIFKISGIYNQFSTEKDMISFGILSRIELNLEDVRETLGEISSISIKEGIDFEERLKNLYLKYEF